MTPASNAPLLSALLEHFGHDAFRPGQMETVRDVLEGKATLAVMPTGAGKSLCYQLPAVLLDGLTVVVSPLVALMKDQVDALSNRGINAAFLNSSQTEAERERVENALASGRLKLLFVAPERFRNSSFLRLLAKVRPVLVAVDEAHCICEWGDTFRPDYALLGDAIEKLAPPRLLALTATAAPDVRTDIVRALRMRNAAVKVAGFDRPNLHLEVHSLSTEGERQDSTVAAVLAHSPAIVYTATRLQTETLTRHLAASGLKVRPYHAGLSTERRANTQDAFLANRIQVVCATNAFGLGIDKPDVRLVLHAQLPRSLESWWQEAGRAGRNGDPAIAGLLYLKKDIFVRRRLLAMSTPSIATLNRIIKALSRARRSMGREELSAATSGKPIAPWEASSALAFLEGAGVVSRHYAPSQLSVRFSQDVTPHGESMVSRLARLVGSRRGDVGVDAACQALGVKTPRELDGVVGQLEREGQLRRLHTPSHVTYTLADGADFGDTLKRRLTVRTIREQERLRAVIGLAEDTSCRRRAVLAAFGETLETDTCGACDACAGSRLTPVRSQRPKSIPKQTRSRAAAWRMSPQTDTVPGLQSPQRG